MRRSGLEQDTLAQVFLPMSQMPSAGTDLFLRTATDSQAIVSAVRREITSMNRNVPVYRVSTLEQRLAASVESRRFQAQLLGLSAALAVLLAAAGIYGVMHYVVAQRTGEMGIRLAFGATGRDLVLLVLKRGLTAVLLGLGTGLSAAWVLTRTMSSLLYNVGANDPATLLGAVLFLLLVALVACLRPAWRASKLDPQVALLHR
jgi:putative ABC transport system permease protein